MAGDRRGGTRAQGAGFLGLIDSIGRGRVALDTALFIYFIEEHPRYLAVIEPLFEEAQTGTRELVTSALTLLEVLVVPYRGGDQNLAARYEQILAGSRGILIVDISGDQLRAAAQLRALTGIRTPDALQLAAAAAAGCTAFVTNDRRIPGVPGTRVLQLADFAP